MNILDTTLYDVILNITLYDEYIWS